MSRKKSSPVPPGSHHVSVAPTATAGDPVGTPNCATAVTAQAPVVVVPAHGPAGKTQAPAERFWLEVLVVRMARRLGSLQLAVFSLVLFALVMAVGTVVESTYSGRVAAELVYRTWWFKLLLALLATNIFFAAAKKWPWKKHQTGFLITHLGLLTLVAGGLVNSFSGTDSLMVLLDSSNQEMQGREGVPQVSKMMVDRDAGLIRVRLPGGDKVTEYAFNPGSLPWRADKYTKGAYTTGLAVLDFLAHPLGQSWGAAIGPGAHLEVAAYYPHVRVEEYSEVTEGDPAKLFPAIKVQLTSPRAGRIRGKWLAIDLQHGGLDAQVSEVGPSLVELLGRCPAALLPQFLNPPAAKKLGTKGLLVIHWQGKTFPAIAVDQALDKDPVTLGDSGLKVKVTKFERLMERGRPRDHGEGPEDPSVQFTVATADGKQATFLALGRLTGVAVPVDGAARDFAGLRVWYHPPDYRYHDTGVMGLLQFVQCEEDGKLYYRSFNSKQGDFLKEDSGPVKGKRTHPIWGAMNWKFRVLEYIPRAVRKPRYVPADLKPGSEVAGYSPAIVARLTVRKDGKEESKEVWLQQSGNMLVHPDRFLTKVPFGDKVYEVGYSVQFRELPFELKLLRAEQEVDPGTQSPASYTSYVQMTDPEKGIAGADKVIWMNHPLDHRGYKVYQSGYEPLGFDTNLRPVNRSTFTVGSDPGMLLKYLGTFMLAGGIVCMFYMRAYFFKPRRRPALDAAAAALPSTGKD